MNAKVKSIIITGCILFLILCGTFAGAYYETREELIQLGEEMVARLNRNLVGIMYELNREVENGKITLEEAKEKSRVFVLGPKKADGTRDKSAARFSLGKELLAYAIVAGGKDRGQMALHSQMEGVNVWDYQQDGRYTVRETWGNPEKTGKPIREKWQNKGEPVYTWLAYQAYFEPWDWVVGIGGKEVYIFKERLFKLKMMFLVVTFVVAAVGILLFRYLIRTMRTLGDSITVISRSADQMIASSHQIASASQALAQASSQQAASMEETTSSLEQMASMTRQNADNATQADALMKETGNVVRSANQSMNELVQSMEEIIRSSQESSKIIKTIDEIAFQTNLLALNAAVEAARAGEAGAGFAVVADEVKNLAMRSADAARTTASLIEGTVGKVESGGQIVDQAGQAFSEVTAASGKVGDLVGEIAAASSEQARGIEQINTSIGEMDKITQANAANAEETSSSSEEMGRQARDMKEFVSTLKKLVSSRGDDFEDAEIGDSAYTVAKKEPLRKPVPRAVPKKAPATPGKAQKEITPEEIIPFDDDDFSEF